MWIPKHSIPWESTQHLVGWLLSPWRRKTFNYVNRVVATMTRSRWRIKHLRFAPRICLTKNQNEMKPFLKIVHQESFLVMLHCSKSFRELKWAFWNSWSQIFTHRSSHWHVNNFGNNCTFYDIQVILLIIALLRSPKMSQLSIIGILEKLDKLSKSNPLRYMTNGSKNKKAN